MSAIFLRAAQHVAQVSGEETLHPVADLNTAERFKPLCIVEKKKSIWFWKKPHMCPTFVKINDILSKEITLPTKTDSFTLMKNFLEKPNVEMSGSISAKIMSEANIDLKANEKINLDLALGDIEKLEVSWENLFESLKDNSVVLDHPLFFRAQHHPHLRFCVVVGSVCTKGDGKLEEDKMKKFSSEDKMGIHKSTVINVEVEGKAAYEKKTVYSFTIPPDTVLAYSCVEFSMSPSNGHVTLHTSFDTLDDTGMPALLPSALPSSECRVPSTDVTDGSNEENLIATIKAHLEPLFQSDILNPLKDAFSILVASSTEDMFLLMDLLLHRAVYCFDHNDSESALHSSNIAHLLKDAKLAAWKQILQLLGFSISADGESVSLPKVHNKNLVKACMGLVDSLMDMSLKSRQLVNKMTMEQGEIVLNVIEEYLQNKTISFKKSKKLEEDLSFSFLKECGFSSPEGSEGVVYTDKNTDALLDAFVAVYVLKAE